MHILVFSYQFTDRNIRLQPWKYVKEIVERLSLRGHQMTLITDVDITDNILRSEVRVIKNVMISPRRTKKLHALIKELNPDVILWPIGAKSASYLKLLRQIKDIAVGYYPGPIWQKDDVIACVKHGLIPEAIQAFLWCLIAKSGGLRKVIASCRKSLVLNAHNKQIIEENGGSPSDVIIASPAYEKAQESGPSVTTPAKGERQVSLYMGWPKKLRGAYLLLDAFEIVVRKNRTIDLIILARGERSSEHDQVKSAVEKKGLSDRVTLVVGFLPSKEVRAHIKRSSFGILPFIHVPADYPLSFLEFFAAGKPVVTTDASGVAEIVAHKRGVVSKRNRHDLANAILGFSTINGKEMSSYREACLSYALEHNSWDKLATEIEHEILPIRRSAG